MKVLLVTVGIFASVLSYGQVRTETQTTKTTWNGTLVDAACQSTRTVHRESVHQEGAQTTRTESTHTETVDCPATVTTTTFGVLTADGQFIRFDNPSNTRVIEIVKTNKALAERAPLKVSVIGASKGDVAIVETLTTSDGVVASHEHADIVFDVRSDGDRGKLVVTSRGVNFEDISEAKHSRSWTYSQIKEFRRDGSDQIKIEGYSGGSVEFRLDGKGMTENVYKLISDRIAAARTAR